MMHSDRGGLFMRSHKVLTSFAILLMLSPAAFAEEVTLPAPVLEWSFYILLIFAACVAIGISIFMKGKKMPGDSLGSLLDEQNPVIHSVGPDVSITECVRRMNELKIGAMLVMEDDQLIGIFTERDAITRVLGAGLDPVSTKISGVMTKNPVSVSTATTLEEAMGIITNQRIRHLPVVEDGKVLGVVSSGDLTYRLIED
jgi:CBS domain-containing protein